MTKALAYNQQARVRVRVRVIFAIFQFRMLLRIASEPCYLLLTNALILTCAQVCNTLGQCHCDIGFSPPNCSQPGDGGSYHSNPASLRKFTTFRYFYNN